MRCPEYESLKDNERRAIESENAARMSEYDSETRQDDATHSATESTTLAFRLRDAHTETCNVCNAEGQF
jgi:hypothetical protein